MSINHNEHKNKKHLTALLTAFGMTVLVGLLIVAVGVNALLLNKPASAAASAASEASASQPAASQPAAAQSGVDQAAVQQLQDQIAQYQSRETQYQSELQQAADTLNQANQQVQQYQQLTQALINAGVIQITSNGQVIVGSAFQPGSSSDDND